MVFGEIVAIGSELVSGKTLNTNAHFLSQELGRIHAPVAYHSACRDIERDILWALKTAWQRSDVIIVTGGLGPTPDDITRDVIARFFNSPLSFHAKQYARICQYFKKKKHKIPFITKREAYFPKAAVPLLNRFGLALGFYVWMENKLLIALPGVPSELIGMYHASVKKLIQTKFPKRETSYLVEAKIMNLYETQIMEKLGADFFSGREFDFGIYPEVGEVTIRLKTRDKRLSSVLKRDLSRKLGTSVFTFDSKELPELILERFVKSRTTLALAESCTGGLLAKRLTDIAGSSRYFLGSVIAYSNQVKEKALKVDRDLLKRFGAVSKQVALKMAEGVRKEFDSSIGLSITGIAGPDGGSIQKPVGLVFIGISAKNKSSVFPFRFSGTRDHIRKAAAQKACILLFEWLNKK